MAWSVRCPMTLFLVFFFFQAEDGIRDWSVTGVQTCALPIYKSTPISHILDVYSSRGYIGPMPKVQIWGYRCERCGHEWVPRERHQEPKVCPHCKSPYWDRPRQSAMPSVNKGRRKRS